MAISITDVISSVSTAAQTFYELVKTVNANKGEFELLIERVKNVETAIIGLDKKPNSERYKPGLEALKKCLDECIVFGKKFKDHQKKFYKKIWNANNDKHKFEELNDKLQKSLNLLTFGIEAQQIINHEMVFAYMKDRFDSLRGHDLQLLHKQLNEQKQTGEDIKLYKESTLAQLSMDANSKAEVHYNLGYKFSKEKKAASALTEYQKAAELGCIKAHHSMGMFYLYGGGGCKLDKFAAYNQFIIASKGGYPRSMYNLALMFENGIGIKKDVRQAIRWYEQAAKLGKKNVKNRAEKKIQELYSKFVAQTI